MSSNSDKLNNIIEKAQESITKSAEKLIDQTIKDASNSILETIDNTTKAETETKIESVSASTEDTIKKNKEIIDDKIKEASEKIVDSALDKMIDDAIKSYETNVSKLDPNYKQEVKNIVRSHKTAFFNADKIIDKATIDTKEQLEKIIDKEVNIIFDQKKLNQQLVTINNEIIDKVTSKIDTELSVLVKLDITKELNNKLGDLIKDPLSDITITLNKYGLNKVAIELNQQVKAIQSSLATSLTKNMIDDVVKQQQEIAKVITQVKEVEKQIQEYEQQIKAEIKKWQDTAVSELKKYETQLVDEISKSIKLNF